MTWKALKVGELAKQTGLTVRALHYYDQIGLLKPSLRTGSDHRLYSAEDVARLQQVLSLRQLGFALEEIRECLTREEFSPLEVVRLHLARLREQIDLERRLCERLEAVAARFQLAEEVSADVFLQTIEAMTMAEQYFTPQQLDFIKARRDEAGEEALRQKQEEWAALIADVRAAMEAGIEPLHADVQELARRWTNQVQETTGGDPEIEESLKRLWDEQGDALAAEHGSKYDPRPVFDYITKAIAGPDA